MAHGKAGTGTKPVQVAKEELGSDGYAARKLIAHISVAFAVPADDILGESKERHIVRARRAVWWVLREMEWSYSGIARVFHRDHSTVMTGIKAFGKALSEGRSWALQMRGELLAPGTVKGLQPPVQEMVELAEYKQLVVAMKHHIAELEAKLVAARAELEALHSQPDFSLTLDTALKAMADKIGILQRERDHWYEMRNHSANAANTQRALRHRLEEWVRERFPKPSLPEWMQEGYEEPGQ